MPVSTIPALGQYGLVADQPPHELPPNAFSSVQNVRFRDGLAERFSGHVSIFNTPPVTPYFITPFGTSTKRYWVYAGLAKIYADDGTTRSDVTGSAPTGAIDDRWTGGALSGIQLLNNGVDVPQYWAGTGTFAGVTGWDANWRVKFLRTFKNYIVYGYPTKSGTAYPFTLGWSAAADPGTLPSTFDPASTTTDAGDVPLGETPDKLVDCLPLGEINIVYKEASMYRMEYIGGQQVFAFKRIPGNYGMLARGCAANTPKGHVVLANGDIVLVDGSSEPQSILTGRYKRTFFTSQLDSTYAERSFVVAHPSRNEVWICYPSPGMTSCDKALVWNWESNTLGQRDLPNATYAASGLLTYPAGLSFDADVGTYDSADGAYNVNDFGPNDARLVMTSASTALYLADSGTDFAGTAITGMLERTGLTFDAPDLVKTWRSITPRVTAAAGTVLYIQFGGSMSSEEAPAWGDVITYTVGTSRKAFGFASGRYLSLRIYSTGAQGWSIKSIDADVVVRGGY